jgi:hypothetical protein
MDRERRRDAYLAQAKAADENAEKATDRAAKERWLKIADNYRNLARHT